MAETSVAGTDSDREKGSGAGSKVSSETEQPRQLKLFRTTKKSHKTTLERLDILLDEMPKSDYVASDNDLPLCLWPEPDF